MDNLICKEWEVYYKKIHTLKQEIGKAVFGQEEVIENSLIALMAGGHILLVGVPGLAKTRLVESLSIVTGLKQKRTQFTPDLMPSDILGSEILTNNGQEQQFRYLKGPIFTQLFMADEINRASPRTQSALLQAMQEYQVSVGGVSYKLEKPFHVLATQNPLEQEGTYPLPEAQLDRFLMQILLTYPSFDTEKRIITETTKLSQNSIEPVLTPETLIAIQNLVRQIPLPEGVVDKILSIVRATRPASDNHLANHYIQAGAGPRGGQALALCARARALFHGRHAAAIEDVLALAKTVLRHRLILNFTARAEGLDADNVLDLIIES